jgi:hypothetical protein
MSAFFQTVGQSMHAPTALLTWSRLTFAPALQDPVPGFIQDKHTVVSALCADTAMTNSLFGNVAFIEAMHSPAVHEHDELCSRRLLLPGKVTVGKLKASTHRSDLVEVNVSRYQASHITAMSCNWTLSSHMDSFHAPLAHGIENNIAN